jgi:hypothetical protein
VAIIKDPKMNRTFTGNNFDYNACVGNNGHIDFITYSDGYDAMVKLGLEKLETFSIPVDILVYPLVYSARHRIELFLKHQLIKIDYIKNKILSNGNTQQIIRTHEISTLWEMFKNQTSFEPRLLEPINEIEEYINDFSQIDDTGEVFRYPLTVGGEKHLEYLNVVNLLSFKKRYIELSSKLETLDYYSSFLITEYEQGTFVGNLSRDVIRKIAIDLPNIESWNDSKGNFTQIKKGLKQKYDLSSNTLSKVIDLIKENFEFAPLIGKELIINDISINELKDFFKLYEDFLIERHTNDFNNTIESKSVLIKEKLTPNAIYSLSQLYDVGYFRLYPEEYQKGLEMKKNENIDVLIRFYLLGNGIVKEKILTGLKICRQTKLLENL